MPAGRALRRDESGFTLIEVLIVFAIIAIVTAITIPAMTYAIDRSKQMYAQRVSPQIASSTTYFYDELLKTLAEGDESSLAGYQA